MALDSRQKRMSAMHLDSPWRGPLVDAPEAGFTQGNRQAAALLYSGILASGAAGSGGVVRERFTLGAKEAFSVTVDPALGGRGGW